MKSKVEFSVSFKCFVVDICVKHKQVKTWQLYFYLNRNPSFIAANDYIQTKSWPAFLAKQLAHLGNHFRKTLFLACYNIHLLQASRQTLSYITVKY